MKDLDARIADRRKREEDRIKSGEARDTVLTNNGGEALDENNKPLGDGKGKQATQGAGGALSRQGEPGKAWPEAPKAQTAAKDPTA